MAHPVLSGVQISFRRLTKVGVASKFYLKLTDVKRHCREVGHRQQHNDGQYFA